MLNMHAHIYQKNQLGNSYRFIEQKKNHNISIEMTSRTAMKVYYQLVVNNNINKVNSSLHGKIEISKQFFQAK